MRVNRISPGDYRKLVEEAYYKTDIPEDDYDYCEVPDDSWAPGESSAKELMKRADGRYGIIDVTKFRKDKIQEALYKCMSIQVGEFLIRIDTYHGYPDKFGKGTNLTMDIEVWKKQYKTLSGNPCNMDFKMDWSKDNRFFGRPWLQLFAGGTSCSANDVPVETVIEIVRWMQALKRMNAFL